MRSNQAELRAYGGTTARQKSQARDRTSNRRRPNARRFMEAKEERETETAAPRSIFGVPIDNLVRGAWRNILRKEVIQPQVPLRLPCYDFTPVADPTVVDCLPCGLAHRLRVEPTPMV